MKFLTTFPEHVELFRLGLRTIETRGWSTDYRGPLALHAGMRDPDSAAARRDPISRRAMDAIPHGDPITRGAITVVVELVDVVPIVGPFSYDEDGGIVGDGAWVPSVVAGDGTLDPLYLHNGDPFGVGGSDISDQLPFGDFAPGRYAWILSNVRPLLVPVPMRGAQGLRDLPADIEDLVREQAAA